MNIAREIISRAYRAGYVVSVDDGDGQYVVHPNTDAAWKIINDVDEATVKIVIAPNQVETLYVIPGLDEDETAANFSGGGWIERTWDDLMEGSF